MATLNGVFGALFEIIKDNPGFGDSQPTDHENELARKLWQMCTALIQADTLLDFEVDLSNKVTASPAQKSSGENAPNDHQMEVDTNEKSKEERSVTVHQVKNVHAALEEAKGNFRHESSKSY